MYACKTLEEIDAGRRSRSNQHREAVWREIIANQRLDTFVNMLIEKYGAVGRQTTPELIMSLMRLSEPQFFEAAEATLFPDGRPKATGVKLTADEYKSAESIFRRCEKHLAMAHEAAKHLQHYRDRPDEWARAITHVLDLAGDFASYVRMAKAVVEESKATGMV
jgi:hypothetical protein